MSASALDAVVIADDAQRYIEVNDAACELLGYTRSELLTLSVRDVVVHDLAGQVDLRRADGSVITAVRRSETEAVPGRHVWVLRLANGIAHDLNNLFAVILSYVDLLSSELDDRADLQADLREIGAAARQSAQLTRELAAFKRQDVAVAEPVELGNADVQLPGVTAARATALSEAANDVRPVALAVLDRTFRIAAVNDEMPALTGLRPGALVGRRAAEVFAPVWDTLEPACREVLTHGEPGEPLRVSWPQGAANRPVSWTIGLRPVREPDGAVSGVALAALDESEGRLLRDQLLQAQKLEALGRLAGGIAHDFNNMLTAIGGYTGLVHADLPDGDPHREDLGEVLKAVDRARVMTLRLLTFVRRAPGRAHVESVDAVARDTERLLRHLIGEDVSLHTVLRSRSAVRMDTGELQQMLVNLAVNARDAMPRGGSLTLETRDVTLDAPIDGGIIGAPPGAYVQITVADTGTGMDPATQKRVFESFFTTKPPGEGSGLGLATFLAAVEQASGDITLTSRVGSGTRFDVYLPRVEGLEAAAATDRPIPRGSEAVLVVDDEAQVRGATVRMLERLGYAVTGVSSARGALDLCQHMETRPDLLVTDVALPDLGGAELVRRCLALAPELKVLYISGFSSGVALEPLLVKPFDQQALGLGVREILDT